MSIAHTTGAAAALLHINQEKQMNRNNVNSTLNILKLAQNFDITNFQQDPQGARFGTLACTIEELHRCGNTACIAGYVAISPAWIALGGSQVSGAPSMAGSGKSPDQLMSEFWGIRKENTEAIIYGLGERGEHGDRYEFEDFVADYELTGMPQFWTEMTKDQAISLFEQLLALDANGVTI